MRHVKNRIAYRFWTAVYDLCEFASRQFDGLAEYADFRQAIVPRSWSDHLWEGEDE